MPKFHIADASSMNGNFFCGDIEVVCSLSCSILLVSLLGEHKKACCTLLCDVIHEFCLLIKNKSIVEQNMVTYCL
jgi:hypothetical protein